MTTNIVSPDFSQNGHQLVEVKEGEMGYAPGTTKKAFAGPCKIGYYQYADGATDVLAMVDAEDRRIDPSDRLQYIPRGI